MHPMHRTRIKFCGITSAPDALAAADAGADAIGIVCDPAAGRYVPVEAAAQIAAALPPMVSAVPVFVDAAAQHVRRTAEILGATTVQLHGAEPPSYADKLVGVRVIKAVRPGDPTAFEAWAAVAGRGVWLLLESAGPGGTGVENDWDGLATLRAAGAFAGMPLVVAGGLTAENVGEVVRKLRPWAVDVSSGVEAGRGVKSPARMAAFVAAVRRADGA